MVDLSSKEGKVRKVPDYSSREREREKEKEKERQRQKDRKATVIIHPKRLQ